MVTSEGARHPNLSRLGLLTAAQRRETHEGRLLVIVRPRDHRALRDAEERYEEEPLVNTTQHFVKSRLVVCCCF